MPSSDYVVRILQVLELTNRPSGEKKRVTSRRPDFGVGVKESREDEKIEVTDVNISILLVRKQSNTYPNCFSPPR